LKPPTIIEISLQQLGESVDRLQARAEWKVNGTGKFSESFVDTNIVKRLTQSKNQLILGRRGTGKTHLLGSLKEHYLANLENDRILPIFMDGRTISSFAIEAKDISGFSILMIYRGFLESILAGMEVFMAEDITLGFLKRHFPFSKDKQKMERVVDLINKLRELISYGETSLRLGIADFQRTDEAATSTKKEAGANMKVTSTSKATVDINAEVSAGLSKVSSKNVAESMKVLCEGLTIIKYSKVGQLLDSIVKELELKSIAILFDEWSHIELEYQPFVAEMIRTTLVPVRPGDAKMFIKFACIPLLTNLSATRSTSEQDIKPIGFPIGEEIFVDVDLDRIYNAYADPSITTLFLLSVLQKHLAREILELKKASFDDAYEYFRRVIFKDDENISELVKASAGVPRDFIIIFAKAFQTAQDRLPMTLQDIQVASNSFFKVEKEVLIQNNSEASRLFDRIRDDVCSPAKLDLQFFLVSRQYSKDITLRILWHNRFRIEPLAQLKPTRSVFPTACRA
jgi:hypothetical protein